MSDVVSIEVLSTSVVTSTVWVVWVVKSMVEVTVVDSTIGVFVVKSVVMTVEGVVS